MKESIKVLALVHINRDPRLQMRVAVDKHYVEQLAEVLTTGGEFDGQLPIVYQDGGGNNWLADGFQRFAAHETADVKKMKCLVRTGTFRDAQQFALSANVRHGARRTNADKKRAVEVALEDEEWGKLSDRAIADLCGVSQPFVGSVRKSPGDNGYHLNEQRTGKDGKTYPAENAKKTPDSKPSESAESDADLAAFIAETADEPETVDAPRAEVSDAEFEVVEEKPAKKASQPVDAWGIPIQEHAEAAFATVPQFKELVSLLRKAQKMFNDLANTVGGKFLQLPAVSSFRRGKKDEEGEHEDRFVMPELENALRKIQTATPTHTVCPWNYVKAKHPEDCKTCFGLNWTQQLTKSADVAKQNAQAAFDVKEDA